MTDERNPSDDAHTARELKRVIDAHHQEIPWLDGEIAYAETDRLLDALSAAGYVVVRAPGLNHGDVLAYGVRRPVPEPATKPCATCDGMGDVAVEFGETPLDYTTAPCSACGGSGVATTEGDKQ